MGRRTAVAAGLMLVAAVPDDPPARRHPRGSPDQGLPLSDAIWTPYHADSDHALNRIFRRIFLADVPPAQVGAALPHEHEDPEQFFAARWMLAWRDGASADRRLFGGDGRQLPREGFTAGESKELRELLVDLGPEDRAALLDPPELAVLFQHDLLRLGQRLLDTEQNPDLLEPLLRAADLVALDAAQAKRLRNPLLLARQDPAVAAALDRRDAELPLAVARFDQQPGGPYREILRRSTRLFDASRTLLWSRLFLAHPDGPEALEAMLPQPDGDKPTVPIGMRAVLLQGIVAFDREGQPFATPVVVDARTQVLANRDPLRASNPTTSRDGVDFGVLLLEREGLRRGSAASFYRLVDGDDQELFRDYGTLKHTTYRAQCALCHRNTATPEPELGGFPVLRPHAEPELAARGDERLRLAERQAGELMTALRAAASGR